MMNNYIKMEQQETFQENCKAQLWDFSKSNTNEQSRIQALSFVAGVVYDKCGVQNPLSRYQKLKVQCNNNTPSRPFQFIPVIFDSYESKIDKKYSTTINQFTYTNLRASIKSGIQVVPYLNQNTIDQFGKFIVIKLRVPIFVRDQIKTHTRISSICTSNRTAKANIQDQSLTYENYWIPSDLHQRVKLYGIEGVYGDSPQEVFQSLSNKGFLQVRRIMKRMHYSKQIYIRYPNGFQMTSMILAGWYNDPHVWQNFLLQRSDNQMHSHWTQHLTRETANVISKLISNKFAK